jgi:hypothetical protein
LKVSHSQPQRLVQWKEGLPIASANGGEPCLMKRRNTVLKSALEGRDKEIPAAFIVRGGIKHTRKMFARRWLLGDGCEEAVARRRLKGWLCGDGCVETVEETVAMRWLRGDSCEEAVAGRRLRRWLHGDGCEEMVAMEMFMISLCWSF